jgi:hypothetical protein
MYMEIWTTPRGFLLFVQFQIGNLTGWLWGS